LKSEDIALADKASAAVPSTSAFAEKPILRGVKVGVG
jgi:hypothetical protein